MLALLIGWIKGLFSVSSDPDDDPTPPHRVFKVDRAGNVIKPDRGVVLRAANKRGKKKTKK